MDLKRHSLDTLRELTVHPGRDPLAAQTRLLLLEGRHSQLTAELTLAAGLIGSIAGVAQAISYKYPAYLTDTFQVGGIIGFALTALVAASFWRAKMVAAYSRMELLAMRLDLAELTAEKRD